MTKSQFDAGAFYAALDSQRLSKRITWKKVGEEAGVSASTLTRMSQGRRPDVDSLAALLKWSGLDVDSFVRREQNSSNSSEPTQLAKVTAYLRSDPNLTEEAAEAIAAVLQAAYEKLRKKQ
ncbi:MAG: helix-turn-helix domain-containing protein [Crinalium sp.]